MNDVADIVFDSVAVDIIGDEGAEVWGGQDGEVVQLNLFHHCTRLCLEGEETGELWGVFHCRDEGI